MFNSPGKKIKILAKVMFWVATAIVLLGVAIVLGSIDGERVLSMLAIAIVFLIALWIESILVYGFGEIIEHLETNNINLMGLRKELSEMKKSCEENVLKN